MHVAANGKGDTDISLGSLSIAAIGGAAKAFEMNNHENFIRHHRQKRPNEWIDIGDIVLDCGNSLRGPVPYDSRLVGKTVQEYITNTSGNTPPLRAVFQKL